jgi:hypothetical protein
MALQLTVAMHNPTQQRHAHSATPLPLSYTLPNQLRLTHSATPHSRTYASPTQLRLTHSATPHPLSYASATPHPLNYASPTWLRNAHISYTSSQSLFPLTAFFFFIVGLLYLKFTFLLIVLLL